MRTKLSPHSFLAVMVLLSAGAVTSSESLWVSASHLSGTQPVQVVGAEAASAPTLHSSLR